MGVCSPHKPATHGADEQPPFPSSPQDPLHRNTQPNNPHVPLGLVSNRTVVQTGLLLARAGGVWLVHFCPDCSNNKVFHLAMHK